MFKRVFSLFLATLIFVSTLSISVYADSNGDYISNNSFWNWLAGTSDLAQVVVDIVPFTGTCSVSEDTRHHAKSYQKDKENGRYKCICTYCGVEFTAYESDLKQSYTDQVSSIPAHQYKSTGSILFTVPIGRHGYSGGSWGNYCNNHTSDNFAYRCNQDIVYLEFLSGSTTKDLKSFSANYTFVFPYDGYYRLIPTVLFSVSYTSTSGVSDSFDSSLYFSSATYTYYEAGEEYDTFRRYSYAVDFNKHPASSVTCFYFHPVFEYVPTKDSTVDNSFQNGIYSISTRPTAITGGNYGIVGDNGQITKIEDNSTIINETNNTYYNPATGQTVPITDWSYNYEDRSYTVTTDSGNTSTITYGDENISIVENNVVEGGDTVTNNYTIYYITNNVGGGDNPENPDNPDDPNSGSSSTPTPPSSCTHQYALTKDVAATCTDFGYKIYTCSLCGDNYTNETKALGHDWQKVTVPTAPADSGSTPSSDVSSDAPVPQSDETTTTATLYRCTRCGVEYWDETGNGPPEKEEGGILGWFKKLFGSIFNGILDVLSSIVGGAIDLICKLIDDLVEGITHVIDSLFDAFSKIADFGGGFKDFLAAFFNYIPSEIITLLAFSISLSIILMILKFFKG